MPYCSNCGTFLPEGTSLCPSCGATVTPPVDESSYRDLNGAQGPNAAPGYNGYQQPGGYQSYNAYQQPGGYQSFSGCQQPGAYSNFTRGPGGYKANIHKRELVLPIILSIITCGIYALVWFFHLVSDLNTAAPEPDDKTPGTVLLLSIITCGIYGLIWIYGAGNKVDRIRQLNGEMPSNSSLIYLLLSLFGLGIVSYCLIQSELNKVAIDG